MIDENGHVGISTLNFQSFIVATEKLSNVMKVFPARYKIRKDIKTPLLLLFKSNCF